MFYRIAAELNKDKTKRAILITGAFLILIGIFLYLFRALGQNLSGEAYYDFQYPYLNPLSTSWKVFFLDRIRSRFMHGVFISILYHLVGYNPGVFYLVIFWMLVLIAVLVALCISEFVKHPWQASLITVTLALLPLNFPDLFQLKKVHHVLAWLLFWLAVWWLKKWIIEGKRLWMLAGTLAFLGSVLAYEATVALLPIVLLLSLPYFKNAKDFLRKAGVVAFISLCTAFSFLRLEDLKAFSAIGQVYPDYSNIGITISRLLSAIPNILTALARGDLLASYIPASGALLTLAQILIVIVLAAAISCAVVAGGRGKRQNWFARLQVAPIVLLLASLYLAFATYLPFMLAGQTPDGDNLRGAAFAVPLIAVAVANGYEKKARKNGTSNLQIAAIGLAALICIVMIGFGLANYSAALQQSQLDEHKLNTFIYTLKGEVPGVRENTIFILVNAQFSRTGCIGMLNMLYMKRNLHCIHLIDHDEQEQYVRTADGLQEVEGRLFPEDFVIITFNDTGEVTLIDQIHPGDFPLVPVTWESIDPLVTNHGMILQAASAFGAAPTKNQRVLIKTLLMQQPSPFYEFMLHERQQMGW